MVTNYNEAIRSSKNVPSEDVVKALKSQLENIESVEGENVTVELIPSKTREDEFFGYVAENCTKDQGHEIFTPDMQFYRMIVDGKSEGVIMVYSHVYCN